MNHSFEITLFLLLEASGEEEREKEINVVASETRLPIDRYTRTFCTTGPARLINQNCITVEKPLVSDPHEKLNIVEA